MTLAIDEKRIGDFAAMTFGVFDLPPGSYEFSSATPESTSSVLVDAATGSISYLCLEVKLGWMYPRVLLQSVDATRGEAGVNRSKMITFAQDERRQRGGAGTAWLVSPNHWVTNAHVVGDRKVVKLTRGADLVIEARVMTIDPVNDLAVLVSDVSCLTPGDDYAKGRRASHCSRLPPLPPTEFCTQAHDRRPLGAGRYCR
jgi:S1-C subfamily serine protease